MTLCIYIVVLVSVGATGAGVGGEALGGAGGSGSLGGVAMPKRCYGFLLDEDGVTDGTMLTFGFAGGGTSGSYCLIDDLGVSLGVYIVVLVSMGATRAGVGGVALCGAGGGGNLGGVAVTQSCYSFLLDEDGVTYRAVVPLPVPAPAPPPALVVPTLTRTTTQMPRVTPRSSTRQ